MEKDAKRPLIAVLLIALAIFAFFGLRKWTEPKETIAWRTNLPAAREEAAKAGKPVLVYFTADWCGPCQMMKRTVWNDARVEEAMRNYVPVKIDVDAQPHVAQEFGVTGIPMFQKVPADGTRGPAHVGAISAQEMVDWLK